MRAYDIPEVQDLLAPTATQPIDPTLVARAREIEAMNPEERQAWVESSWRDLEWNLNQVLPARWQRMTSEVLGLLALDLDHPMCPALSLVASQPEYTQALQEQRWWFTTLPGLPGEPPIPFLLQSAVPPAPGDRLSLNAYFTVLDQADGTDGAGGVDGTQSTLTVLHPVLAMTSADAASVVLGAIHEGSAYRVRPESVMAFKPKP